MPDYFSHIITADKILEKLPFNYKRRIENRYLYLLGAQGGDVFFTYNLKVSKTNLGRKLHMTDPVVLFDALKEGNPSYAAGFAAHYALDCTLHPAIYAFEAGKNNPLAHNVFEGDLGLYISRKYASPRKILPKNRVMGATFTVYDSVRKVEDGITVTGVERCLSRHFIFTRFLYRNKRQTYRYDFDYSSLAGAIEDGIAFGTDAVCRVLDKKIDENVFSRSFLEKQI